MSAYPQSYGQQWPQGPPNQYSPMSSQGSPYTHYAPHGYPTPITPYGSQYPSPASAQSQSSYQNGVFPQQGQYQQQYSSQPVITSQSYQGQPSLNQNPALQHMNPTQPQQKYSFYSGNPSAHTPGTPYLVQGGGAYGPQDHAAWIPNQDDPQVIESTHGEITWLAPKPVGRPLAATFSQSEAQDPLPPLWPEESGKSVSKYISLDSLNETCASIRNSNDWENMSNDPIFREIGDDRGLVPIDELLTSRGRYEGNADRDQTRASSSSSDHGGNQSDQPGWSVMDNLEYALNSGDFTVASGQQKQAPSEPFDMAEMEQLDRAEEFTQRTITRGSTVTARGKETPTPNESQEVKLARLGVTGAPKPVVSRVPSQSIDCNRSRRRSRSPTYDRRQSSDSCSSGTHTARYQNYRERDSVTEKRNPSRQNSYGNGDGHATLAGINNRRSSQQQYGHLHMYGMHNAPPPPPPPPLVHSYKGVDNRSPPPSQESLRRASRGSSEAPCDNQPSSSGRRSASPSGFRPKTSTRGEREYRERDRLGEKKYEPQRQPDDLAAKRKRSQPQVADAYR
ncbi:MAG: hypothetical protein M1840_000733 [Geoglossum simile]|nr:MAG: hypothetical protein M1840_000733 [Geoglossum simile]